MKYIILILTFIITSVVSYSQTKHPKKKSIKTYKIITDTIAIDSIIHRAALRTIDSLKAKGYIKN